MQNSRLMTTFSSFSKAEWRSFMKYLRSPYFNQREDVELLAAVLFKGLTKGAEPAYFAKEKIWSKVFPGKAFDDKQLRYTMSYLLDLAEKFLVSEELQSNQQIQRMLAFSALRKHGLETSAQSWLTEVTEWSDIDAFHDPAIKRVMQRHLRDVQMRQSSYTATDFAANIDFFTHEMLLETIREGCAFLDFKANVATELAFPLLHLALEFCEKEALMEKLSALAMIYHTYRMLEKMPQGGGINHFNALKRILNQGTEIPMALKRESWLRAINFAIRQQNQGNKAFGKEAFELYKSGISSGLILENGQISKKAYSNTLVLALLVGEWEWAETFLSDYKNYLPEHERDNTYRHNLATLFFKQKQFEKVLQSLQSVAFTDSLHNLDDRRLLLCSYFELGEWDALDSLLDSFGIWLRRAKNLGYHREMYANLVKFTRRLVELMHQNQQVKSKLKQEITATKYVAAKEWLLEKLGVNA